MNSLPDNNLSGAELLDYANDAVRCVRDQRIAMHLASLHAPDFSPCGQWRAAGRQSSDYAVVTWPLLRGAVGSGD